MKKFLFLLLTMMFLASYSCGNKDKSGEDSNNTAKTQEVNPDDPKSDKGVGPVTSLVLDEKVDDAMAKKGEEIYKAKCTACHKVDAKYIGPSPQGIFDRRSPEWIMNMILNPEKMIAENELTKKLVMENNGAVMANQNLTHDEARAVLEFFRTIK